MRIKHVLTRFEVECLEVRIRDCLFLGDKEKALELIGLKINSYHSNTNERGVNWRLIDNTGDSQ